MENMFREKLSSAAQLMDVLDLTNEIVRGLNFDYFTYAICELTPFMRPTTHVYGTFPADWVLHYKTMNYAVIDPTIQHCKLSINPALWSDELFEDCPTFWAEAKAFNLKYGLTQPSFNVNGMVGLFSLSRKQQPISPNEFNKIKPLIKSMTAVLCEKIFQIDKSLNTSQDIDFKSKEIEVLRWVADGKTSEEIGIILGVTADAVNFHLRNIQNKIGASNRVQAITYAVAQGYI